MKDGKNIRAATNPITAITINITTTIINTKDIVTPTVAPAAVVVVAVVAPVVTAVVAPVVATFVAAPVAAFVAALVAAFVAVLVAVFVAAFVAVFVAPEVALLKSFPFFINSFAESLIFCSACCFIFDFIFSF